jgi:nicotinate-nucleotide adenylyltransferase
LGGSFNPAHRGHRHLSLLALKRLGLDQVWWLVSPQNPLKSSDETAPLLDRLIAADMIANHPRIHVTALEEMFGTNRTADSICALKRGFPGTRFVWLMGADNLGQFHRWHHWRRIARDVSIAVFNRAPHAHRALLAPAAMAMRRARCARIGTLAGATTPAWGFVPGPLHLASSTAIRAGQPGARAAQGGRRWRLDITSQLGAIDHVLDTFKAVDIVRIDVTGRSSLADHMIIASGRSSRQVAALATNVVAQLKAAGLKDIGVEGLSQADWVAIDTGDVLVHLFRPEVRAFYDLEGMWADGASRWRADAPPLPPPTLLAADDIVGGEEL